MESTLTDSRSTTSSPQVEGLQKEVLQLRSQNQTLESHNRHLEEKVALLTHKLYGRSSEKGFVDERQGDFFTEATPEEEFDSQAPPPETDLEEACEPSENKPPSKRKKRKSLPAELPRFEKIIDIPEEEKHCACGASLSCIGQESCEKLEFVPAHFEVLKIIRPKYACRSCEGSEDPETPVVRVADPPEDLLPKSIATPSLLTHIIIAKYQDSLPLYRQEQQFERLAVPLGRNSMASWILKAYEALKPLESLLHQELLACDQIGIDETRFQVLKEPGRSAQSLSHLWVLRGQSPKRTLLRFHYDPSRSQRVASELLEGFGGVVQSDGYAAYSFLDSQPRVEHAACWVHARRYFKEAQKAASKAEKRQKQPLYETALKFIQKIYKIEKQADQQRMTDAQRGELRQTQTRSVLKDFKAWLDENHLKVPPQSLTGKAMTYTLKHWEQLQVFLKHPALTPDNNQVENQIRPFVIGRKNFLFADSQKGAHASAFFYSLIQSAKANGLTPQDYLKGLFTLYPKTRTPQQRRLLLPHLIEKSKLQS